MLLRASGLVVRHHPSHPPALAGVDIEVAAGEVVGVIGANGSGKSTLGRALIGLQELEAGHVVGPSGGAAAGRVGLVLQDPAAQLIAVTVADEIALGPEGAGRSPAEVAHRVDALVKLHGLDALWHRDPAKLSGGQQQRVAVAAIEACDVDVLVLDEPTALLDRLAREQFACAIRAAAAGRGVVWITQDPDELEQFDRVVVLEAGTVAWSGTAREFVAQPHVASSLGLEQPVAARIAHALIARGVWPNAGVPLHERELVALLVDGIDGSRVV